MKALSIDLGSYSIKFYEAKIDGKKVDFLSKRVVVIDLIKSTLGEKENLLDYKTEIVSEFLSGKDYNGKIIYQISNDFLSNRTFTVPVTSRKKVEAMIPFQLEENIPYSLSKIHFTRTLNILSKTTIASVYITNKVSFDKYFEMLKSKKILPWHLTCEMAVFENLVKRQSPTFTSCILDLGHESTKAYFFDGDRLISNHFSHVAGKLIDETVAQTYQISQSDAVIYKHENCFFLLEEQYEKVEKDQKDFALLMKQTFWPLILKIRQWMIGFKALCGKNVEKIYITGGTCKIKNIENFLIEALGTQVEFLNPYPAGTIEKTGLEDKEKSNFSLAFLMAHSLGVKPPLPNFLIGDYSIAPKNRISIFNLAFLATRSTILLLVLSLGFIFENFFLHREEVEIEKKLTTIFKYPALKISEAEKKNFKKSPELVLNSLNKKSKDVGKEIENLKKTIRIYPILSLKSLSNALLNLNEVDLTSYQFDETGATSTFKAQNPQAFNLLVERFKTFGASESQIELKSASNELIYKSAFKE